MKKTFFLLSLLPLFVACDKDDDTTIEKNSHRIKQAIYNATDKEVYTYDGENLVGVTYYSLDANEEWVESYKEEYSYSGNNITRIKSEIDDGTWIQYGKSEIVLQDGLITEEMHYSNSDDAWQPDWKWNYQYSANNISAWRSYEYSSETNAFIQDGKSDYVYNGGILTENIEYSSGEGDDLVKDFKYSFSFDGGSLSNIIGYNWNEIDNVWESDYKNELIYSGKNVSTYNHYNSVEESWVLSSSIQYTYNSEGYLSGYTEGEYTTTYEYEEGNGNAELLSYYPEEIVNGEPTLKSAGTDLTEKYIPYYQRIRNW